MAIDLPHSASYATRATGTERRRTVKIIGQNYTMRRDVSANNSGVMGMCNNANQEIVFPIEDDSPRDLQESVVLHEILEALDFMFELDIEHRSIQTLEAGLYQVLTDAGVDLSPLLKELGE
jgi:hypothetical protein